MSEEHIHVASSQRSWELNTAQGCEFPAALRKTLVQTSSSAGGIYEAVTNCNSPFPQVVLPPDTAHTCRASPGSRWEICLHNMGEVIPAEDNSGRGQT